jgi:hypothetical protein
MARARANEPAATDIPDDSTFEAQDAGGATRPDETVPGGLYMTNTTLKNGKHYGGQIKSADGKVLREFKDDEENTGKLA